jgi:hypothetical protein
MSRCFESPPGRRAFLAVFGNALRHLCVIGFSRGYEKHALLAQCLRQLLGIGTLAAACSTQHQN